MKRHWILFVTVGGSILVSAIAYPFLEETVPTHYTLEGVPDDYGSKWIPLLVILPEMLLLYVILYNLGRVSFKGDRNQYRSFTILLASMMFMLFGLHAVIVLIAAGVNINMFYVLPFLFGGLVISMSFSMRGIKQNHVFGMRLPWTLENEEVWDRSNEFSARLFIIIGILICATALIEGIAQFIVMGVLFLVGLIISVVQSYVVYKKS
jgi:uncharacterized membrane protein